MAHFAKIENGVVTQVIVAEQDFISTGILGDPASWIQTSYNTRGGVHYGADNQPDDLPQLRMNFAGIGYSYDETLDAFIPPQPYDSWTLDESTCLWVSPIPMPDDGKMYKWDEETESWVEME
jgi:hypothetical protein